MIRTTKIKLAFLLSIISLVGLFGIYNLYSSLGSPRFKKIYLNNQVLYVEIADTPLLRSKGLSERKSLPKENGMLFVFDKPGYYSFWMKGMNFPLDFIWIRNNIVVDLTENVATGDLPTFTSKSPADKVIEANTGVIKSIGIKIGDWIQFK